MLAYYVIAGFAIKMHKIPFEHPFEIHLNTFNITLANKLDCYRIKNECMMYDFFLNMVRCGYS